MAKKRLNIKDKTGLPVDYDISAENVTIDGEGGKPLTQKLDEIAETEAQAVRSITFNGQSYNRDNGIINIGEQEQPNWNESNPNYRTYIRNKPTLLSQFTNDCGFVTSSQIPEGADLSTVFASVAYDPTTSRINFFGKGSNTVLAYLDAAPFIVDGMVENVTLDSSTNELVITFNTASGKSPIRVPLGSISGQGTVQSVKMNGGTPIQPVNGVIDLGTVITEHQSLSSYATKSELNGKQDKLTGSDVLSTINGTQVHYGESVNVVGQKGEKGDKGDTGNVQVDGNGNVLIYNGLDMRQTGAALDAYQGYVLALTKGTFAQAWLKSQFVTVPFCWVLSDTIDGDTILKPIWYVGNGIFVDAVGAEVLIEAESVPITPTMTINGETPTSGAEVPKNTQVVITPSADSVLYYRIGSGDYMKSAIVVTLTLTNEGTNVIDAYCANNKGNSTHNELSLSVAGVPVPVFGAAQGTTINGTVVSRGGSIVISGDADGDLYYKVGDATQFTQVQGTGGAAPQATVQISGTGSTVIEAYNSINGDTSQHVTMTYTMVALTPPTMAMSQTTETANEFPSGGGTLSMSAPSGTIHYTTDDSAPTENSTQYNTPISISSRTTVKAIAHDAWGNSEVVTNTYTVKQPKIKVEVNDATTMSLGDTGLTAITLDGPTGSETTHINEFTIEDLNALAGTSYTSFADHVFASLSFGDKMKIVSFDGGGVRINSLNYSFNMGSAGSPLKKVVGIVLAPIGSTGASAISAFQNDYVNPRLAEIEISGEINGSMANFIATNSGAVTKLDLSGLTGTVTAAESAFKAYKGTILDITGLEINASSAYGMFRAMSNCTTLKIKKVTSSGTVTNMFTGTNGIKTLVSTNEEPYNAGWLAAIGNGLTAIYVPDNSVSAYKAHESWSAYEDKIFGISNYNE